MSAPEKSYDSKLASRHRKGRLFLFACLFSTWFGVVLLAVMLAGIAWQAFGWLDWGFLTRFDSYRPHEAGVLAGLWGSFWLILLATLFTVPIGVGAAVYLEEYARDNWLTRIIQINLANLAGVPSIVYGILGLTVFVRMFGIFQSSSKVIEISLGFATLSIPLPMGRTVISGALTLGLLVLPVVIVSAREALRAVPPSIRHASLALGATQWQTIRHQIVPAALPGILTGVILSISRAIGETAPLILVGAWTYLAYTPGEIESPLDVFRNPQGMLNAPFDSFTALPIQIYNWVSRPEPEYQHVAAAGIIVLLSVLLTLNAAAIYIRQRAQKRARW